MYQQTFPFAFPDPLSQRPMPPATASTPNSHHQSPANMKRSRPMHQATAKISLSSLSEFGYYPMKGQAGASRRAHHEPFGSLAETLTDLVRWSGKLTLGRTATHAPREGQLNVFCKGVAQSDGDWVLSLVQEAPTSAGGVLQFDLSSKVGAVRASSTPVEEGSIAGWATHYWFLPAEGKVATVKIDESPPSLDKMRRYVLGFMARHASRVQPQEGEEKLLYKSPSGLALACRVKFLVDAGRDLAAEQRILAGQVERIILRESVPVFLPKKQPQRTGLLSIFGPLLGRNTPREITEESEQSRVEARITKGLTKQQTRALIDGWQRELDPWANLGFEVKTDRRTETLWLERQRNNAHVELRVERDSQGVVNLESLAGALSRGRSAILDSFRSTP